MKPMLQQQKTVAGGEASSELESSINRAKSGGQSLDSGLQQSMGQAMGADFSGVKVHTDDRADQLNQSIQAKAFTTGKDVFFRQGTYQPSSRGGQELIAHELTHVVQQGGTGIQRASETIKPEGDRPNKTGLPDRLKAGVENLSGIAMDDVKVHYNSSKPTQLQAYAYTEGTDIHVASGQEKHLPHEAWHVVQQKQGRVQPSLQLKGIKANVDFSLEREANVMGAKADNIGDIVSRLPSKSQAEQSSQLLGRRTQTLQRTTGTPVRQFGNGGTVEKNIDEYDGLVARDQLVIDGLVEEDEIINVEVARNFVPSVFGKDAIETVTKHVQVYKILDTTHYFYTATSDEAAKSILVNGLDPNWGGKRDPKTITGWNSRGHVYFTVEPSTANGYGKNVIKPSTGSYSLLKFTLPAGHPVTLDPELGSASSAFRTNKKIPASNIERA
nr:DUF4157 domain-containing protein [Spirulina major]